MNSGIGNLVGFAVLGLATLMTGCMAEAQDQSEFEPEAELGSQSQAVLGPWQMVFSDQFTGSGNWQMANRKDYNSNICNYQSSNVSFGTEDGKSVMKLTATKVNGSDFRSGHVKSNFSFKPGWNEEYKVSSYIKLIAMNGSSYTGFSSTYGAWPAFWTVQENAWPTQGEIDIMEGYSFGGSTKFAANLFYGTTSGQNQLGNTQERTYSVGEGWHWYDQYWKNQNGNVTVTIAIDGVTRATYTNANHGSLRLQNFGPHNIIFNLNVGSNSGIFNNNNINLFSKTMMWVDQVKVEKRTL
jgi:hypothetical protein